MNRKVKNLIIILVIIVMIGLSFITINSAKNSIQGNLNVASSSQNGMGTPPDMPSGSEQGSQNQMSNSQTPPDMPNQSGGNSNNQTPPEKPSGSEQNSQNQMSKPDDSQMQGNEGNNGQTPPEMPSQGNGNGNNQTPPEMPNQNGVNGNSETAKISTIYYVLFAGEALVVSALLAYLIVSNFSQKTLKETFSSVGTIVIFLIIVVALTTGLTLAQSYIANSGISSNTEQNQMNNMNNMQPGGGMNSNGGNVTYTATKEIAESSDLSGETITSTNSDENGILVTGDIEVNISDVTVEKSGDSDGGDSSNFYGNNSAIIAKDGATLNIDGATVTTNASGANGVFSYGGSATTNNSSSDGTTVNISNSQITTTGDNAGGIMTTGGGKTVASNLIINTSGTSSAAIRSDRGGGTVVVDKGTYTTTGNGSPAIYSTADITVSNATLIAKASEGVVIEGANTVNLENCDLTDSNTKLNGQSTTYKNVFLYQSMSGDASTGTATFTAKNSNITTNNGDSFYITNTTATINLNNNTIINNDTTGNFLRAQKDSWGTTGSNGGNVTLNMTSQTATGNIVIDSISTLAMNLETESYYEGTINSENTAKEITLKLDSTSKIKLTGNSYVTTLEDADTTYSNIDFNGYTLYVNGTAINK